MLRFLFILLLSVPASGQVPSIQKIDPPDWWATMPGPMLLVYGENLTGAQFSLSDGSLHIDRTVISANGHYAELWVGASPSNAETIQVTARTPAGQAVTPYTFAARRNSSDGFAGFSSSDVMYLIMIDRFADGDPTNDGLEPAVARTRPRGWHGGDLRGITQHLDYLQQLGITTIWITPVYQNHGEESYHGYGATDLYAVDEHFGTLADLKVLAAALHARHMKLVLDIVPNHVGPGHPWVTDSPDPNWFHGTPEHHTIAEGNFAPLTDPHAPWRDQRNVTEGWFANVLPDLNQENPAVAQYLTQNTIWWIEQAGIDGLRIDTFPYVGRAFWHNFLVEISTLYPKLTTVGEVFNEDPTIVSTFAGGVTRTGVDTNLYTPFDFPSYDAIRDVFHRNASMSRLPEILRLDNLYPHPERLIPFLDNHDTSRFTNDDVSPQMLQLAFTILTTMRGMPLIYSGDEISMRGGDDPDNRHDFPGGFGAVPNNAFLTQGRSPEQQQAFSSLQTLLALRRSHPALQFGAEQVLHADHDVLVYVRSLQRTGASTMQHILVAVNKGTQAADTRIELGGTALEAATHSTVLLGSSDGLSMSGGEIFLHISPSAAVIAELDSPIN